MIPVFTSRSIYTVVVMQIFIHWRTRSDVYTLLLYRSIFPLSLFLFKPYWRLNPGPRTCSVSAPLQSYTNPSSSLWFFCYLNLFFSIMYMRLCTCIQHSRSPKEGIWSPEVTGHCKLLLALFGLYGPHTHAGHNSHRCTQRHTDTGTHRHRCIH